MNKRDLELLSAYLDGELKPADSTKLEARLKSDLQLASVLNDLRSTRTLLRKLPSRKAPRNFTLTRKMVGQNPPLPRTYPVFRFATAIATLLFVFSVGFNTLMPQLVSQPPAFGMGGGGGAEVESYAAEAPVEEPALEQPAAPMPAAPESTAAADASEPSIALAPQGTEVPPTEALSTMMETPAEKNGTGGGVEGQDQLQTARETQRQFPLIPSIWVIGLAVVAVIGALVMGLMRQFSARRWK